MRTLESLIRDVPDFPKPGIVFKDITPLLRDPEAFREIVDTMVAHYKAEHIDLVLGIESRGFILGPPIAYRLGAGFVPVRKAGRLPWKTIGESYALEYGTDRLEIHTDAVAPGQSVLIVDDLLATGGTARAVTNLMRRIGANVVGIAFLIELTFLKGRDKLDGTPIFSLVKL